ncbi:hypothetical protein [uncultured Microbacterium sp.]|jgi:hypothetical protein|uniref:hypothetical protein n=1 Tax=uncultured Microbacterium sp. TaxID=191216 RepID=UPI0028D678BF|nr:hypothetical protein [uncultured Microbacterium sp.]
MRRLHYSGGYVLTADDVCRALLRYARALADTQSSDVVSIPVLTEGGARGNAHFLIGPASQLYSTPVSEAVEEIEDASLVEELQRRTRRLQTDVAEWPDMMEDANLGYGEDEY